LAARAGVWRTLPEVVLLLYAGVVAEEPAVWAAVSTAYGIGAVGGLLAEPLGPTTALLCAGVALAALSALLWSFPSVRAL
jgi:hypothetical protein